MLISERTNTSTIERWCALVILALGALHCLAARQYLNADGMSYIEVAENLLHFGRESVNSYFSPLYSWMLIPLIALHPGPYWELPLVQCVNFAILILALACFRFFFRQLTLRFTPVSPAAWILIGYSMFAWCALYMISPRLMTPDMLYASILFLIFGLLLKIFAGDHSWRVAIVLGILWGVAYWCRAAFMPWIPSCIVVAFLAFGANARAFARTGLALVTAALLAGPWIAILSQSKGYLTMGTAGILNYAWQINGRAYQHERFPQMPHPTRLVYEYPNAYEFARPLHGTYPPWTDPSYWNEGLPVKVSLAGSMVKFITSSKRIALLALEQGGFLASLIALWFWSGAWKKPWATLRPVCWLLVLGVIGVSIYATLNPESRYFAGFWAVFWLTLWASVHLPETLEAQRPYDGLGVAVAVTTLAAIVLAVPLQFYYGAQGFTHLRTAQALADAGVAPDTPVATINVDNDVQWARFARVRVIAEIPSQNAQEWWNASPASQYAVRETFRIAGARFLVAKNPPPGVTEWKQLGSGPFYLTQLP